MLKNLPMPIYMPRKRTPAEWRAIALTAADLTLALNHLAGKDDRTSELLTWANDLESDILREFEKYDGPAETRDPS